MDDGFHNNNNGGWYPHDGEGKGMCTGPGCDCDERNYGSHPHSSKSGISTLGAILCAIGGLIGACMIFVLLGIEEPPLIVCIILWVVVSTVLSVLAEKIGL
jgi:hypothetical protein